MPRIAYWLLLLYICSFIPMYDVHVVLMHVSWMPSPPTLLLRRPRNECAMFLWWAPLLMLELPTARNVGTSRPRLLYLFGCPRDSQLSKPTLLSIILYRPFILMNSSSQSSATGMPLFGGLSTLSTSLSRSSAAFVVTSIDVHRLSQCSHAPSSMSAHRPAQVQPFSCATDTFMRPVSYASLYATLLTHSPAGSGLELRALCLFFSSSSSSASSSQPA